MVSKAIPQPNQSFHPVNLFKDYLKQTTIKQPPITDSRNCHLAKNTPQYPKQP